MAGQRAIQRDIADNLAVGSASISDRAPLKLEQFLPYRLNVVTNLVSQALSRVYARRYRIGVPEWRVLVTLGQFGVMTGKAIGAHTHMHKTKVSRAVALMEKRKLLQRRSNRDDMRESFLSLTTAGRTMYEEVAPHALDFACRLTERRRPVKLYSYFRSSAAYRVRIALNLKGLSYDMTSVHLVKEGGHNRKPEYRAINPQMRVPALLTDGGDLLIQSLAIIEYLDETHPSPPLLPKDPLARAKVR